MKLTIASVRTRIISAILACGVITAASLPARADVKASVESILTLATTGSEAQKSALGKQLAELGAQADALLFDELSKACAASSIPTGPRPAVLLSAFEQMGTQRWRPLIVAKLGTGTDPTVIAPIFAIAGHCGSAEDVQFVLYAAAFDHDGLHRAGLEKTVTSILLRHAPAFEAVDRAIPAILPDLRSSMIRAVEATKRAQAAPLLARWIETRREMRFECLTYLSRLSLSLQKPFPPDVTAPVRALVESGDEDTLNEAVLCSGRLGDCDAIAALIKHLKEGEYGLRAAALWALQSITKLQFGKDPREWSAWFEDESRWWNEDSRRAFALLVRGSKAEKVEALRQVSRLHAWRDRAAAEIAIALDDLDADIATLTAAELKRLDSMVAVPALIDALSGGRPAVADAARAALQSITKRDLPSDPMAVREALVPAR